ncbi:MAG: hypothetical protein K0U66_11170 [Gammaproteobacteria bacterium]|nr:hypothetical protein [Gammaproteobacteria bacterium]
MNSPAIQFIALTLLLAHGTPAYCSADVAQSSEPSPAAVTVPAQPQRPPDVQLVPPPPPPPPKKSKRRLRLPVTDSFFIGMDVGAASFSQGSSSGIQTGIRAGYFFDATFGVDLHLSAYIDGDGNKQFDTEFQSLGMLINFPMRNPHHNLLISLHVTNASKNILLSNVTFGVTTMFSYKYIFSSGLYLSFDLIPRLFTEKQDPNNPSRTYYLPYPPYSYTENPPDSNFLWHTGVGIGYYF